MMLVRVVLLVGGLDNSGGYGGGSSGAVRAFRNVTSGGLATGARAVAPATKLFSGAPKPKGAPKSSKHKKIKMINSNKRAHPLLDP